MSRILVAIQLNYWRFRSTTKESFSIVNHCSKITKPKDHIIWTIAIAGLLISNAAGQGALINWNATVAEQMLHRKLQSIQA